MFDAEFWIVGKELGTGLQPSAFAKATADKATEATGPLFRPFFSLPTNQIKKWVCTVTLLLFFVPCWECFCHSTLGSKYF